MLAGLHPVKYASLAISAREIGARLRAAFSQARCDAVSRLRFAGCATAITSASDEPTYAAQAANRRGYGLATSARHAAYPAMSTGPSSVAPGPL